MVIGIDASRANLSQRTGTEWYSFYVIEELKRLIPKEYSVVLYTKEGLKEELAALPENWSNKVLRWPFQLLWTQARLSIEMILHPPDLLYVPAHTIPILHPKKVVTVLHDIGFERDETLYSDTVVAENASWKKRIVSMLVQIVTFGKYTASEKDYHKFSARFALENASHILTVSEFSKQEMMEVYNVSTDKITVAPNGIAQQQLPQSVVSESVLERYKITKPYILYIGRIERKKNIERLINAFDLLRSEYGFVGTLVLCGAPGHDYKRIQSRIKYHSLEDVVIQPGWTEQADLSIILQEATVFALPSQYEGFGIPILEAMHAGVPVACSKIPPLVEVGADAALYFDPNSEKEMADVLHTVLTDTQQRNELVVKGKARINAFSWTETATTTWKKLQCIMDE